jgi:hypothetical protein
LERPKYCRQTVLKERRQHRYGQKKEIFDRAITKVYARERGCGIHPGKHAELVTGRMRTEQALEKPQ